MINKKTFVTQNAKKYKKIINIINNYKISKFELISNYGLYSGDTNLFKTLTIYDIVKRIKNIKGDIIEFGVWKGNTSFLIKKILDVYKIKKKIYLFDHFKGLIHFTKNDSKKGLIFRNKYIGNKKLIKEIIKFFNFKKIYIIDKDATELTEKFFTGKKFSLVIMDVDLYEPSIKILNSIEKNLSRKGLIVFDEGNSKIWSGEKKAMDNFLKKYEKKYKKEFIPYARQPDVILKKI
jgi:hypothetical protein